MTTLVVEELVTTLTQTFDLSLHPRYHVGAARIHLYVHNNPSGTFTISLLDANDNAQASYSFTAQDVYDSISTSNPYAQTWFPITFSNIPNIRNGAYKFRLSSSGYTFSASSYIGWVRDHEDLKNNLTYTPINDLANPLSYEIWVNQ